jgi:hypothetical protein
MNYEKSYNKYIQNIPYYTNYEEPKFLNKSYAFMPAINKYMPKYHKHYMHGIDGFKYDKHFTNDIDVNNYTKQFINDIDINKYTKQLANDIDIHADINKIYNNEKYLPIKVPNSNGITLIIIKNQLTGEVENENKDNDRCIEDIKRPAIRKTSFTIEEAAEIAKKLGIDFSKEKFNIEDFKNGLNVELEHGLRSSKTNVTNDDPILTGKIALAHLNEFPDYYVRLKRLEDEAKAFWALQRFI